MAKLIVGNIYTHPGPDAGPTIHLGGGLGYDFRCRNLWMMDDEPFARDKWKLSGKADFVFTAQRPDFGGEVSYKHYFIRSQGKTVIIAGCHRFISVKSAQDHWHSRFREGCSSADNHRLNDWSLRFIERAQAAYLKSKKAPAKPRRVRKKPKPGAAAEVARRTRKRKR